MLNMLIGRKQRAEIRRLANEAQRSAANATETLAEVSAAPSTQGRCVRREIRPGAPPLTDTDSHLLASSPHPIEEAQPGGAELPRGRPRRPHRQSVCQEMTHSAHTCIKNTLLSCSAAFNQSPVSSERKLCFVPLILTSIDGWGIFFLFNLVYFKAMEKLSL